jgi:hypothetical protein
LSEENLYLKNLNLKSHDIYCKNNSKSVDKYKINENYIINSESNELNNDNYNNLNTSGNSFIPNNINASSSEMFYARKNYKEKLIEIYTLSEKIIMFIELFHKMKEEETSSKPNYGNKELKILFEESKLELLKNSNDSYNKAKIDLEKELNKKYNLTNPLNLSPNRFSNNINKTFSNNSIKNKVNHITKKKINVNKSNGNIYFTFF